MVVSEEVWGASRRETEGAREGMIHHAPTLPPKIVDPPQEEWGPEG